MGHWQRLPRAAAGAPSLAVLKARLDGAGSSLVWWEVSLGAGIRGSLSSLPNPSVILRTKAVVTNILKHRGRNIIQVVL